MRKPAALLLYAWLYLGWFACVLMGRHGLETALLIVPAIGWILFWQAPAPRDAAKVLLLCLAGMAADAVFLKLGVIRDPQGSAFPLWLASLWLLFAPAIYLFTGLFGRRFWLAALAGGILGPLSYKSGEGFGVLELQGLKAIFIYAAFWAGFIPLAMVWVRRVSTP
jgi:hypothetical protein